MSRINNYARAYDNDRLAFIPSKCLVEAGTPLPEKVCAGCAHYVHGRLELNCEASAILRSVGPLQPACPKFTTKKQIIMEEHFTKKETPATKVCPKCGRELPAEAFGKHARAKDGLQPFCKECRSKIEKGNPKYGRRKKDGTVSIPAAHAQEVRAFVEGRTASNPSVKEIPDHDLATELRRRGYDVRCTKTIEL